MFPGDNFYIIIFSMLYCDCFVQFIYIYGHLNARRIFVVGGYFFSCNLKGFIDFWDHLPLVQPTKSHKVLKFAKIDVDR